MTYLNIYSTSRTARTTIMSLEDSSVVRWSIELYKCREKLCSTSRAVNWSTVSSRCLSASWPGRSHANIHWLSALQHLSRTSSSLSNTSTQFDSSHCATSIQQSHAFLTNAPAKHFTNLTVQKPKYSSVSIVVFLFAYFPFGFNSLTLFGRYLLYIITVLGCCFIWKTMPHVLLWAIMSSCFHCVVTYLLACKQQDLCVYSKLFVEEWEKLQQSVTWQHA